MFSTPETSVHVRDKNCEISRLERERERERKVKGKGSGEKMLQKLQNVSKYLCLESSRHTYTPSFIGQYLSTMWTGMSNHHCGNKTWWRWAVVTTKALLRRAKLQSDHHSHTNPYLFTGRMSFMPANQQCQSTGDINWTHKTIKKTTGDGRRLQ